MAYGARRYGRFFQLGYVTRDIHRAIAHLTGAMGARQIDLFEDFHDEQGRPRALHSLSHLVLDGAELELIQPRMDRDSLYLEALPADEGAIALHHIGYIHPDIPAWEAAMAAIRADGPPIAVEGATSWARYAYLDTRATLGHYSEIVYRDGGSMAEP